MKIVALAGGVGGAKFANGLAQVLEPSDTTIIVNTGDDFEHLGLYISPDVDTVCYTLAGLSNRTTGWGLQDDTYLALRGLKLLGGPTWFHLGDKDLATHLERTRRMKEGCTLQAITHDFCNSWGIRQIVLPMSNQPIRTMVETMECGMLPFQEYFVHAGCEPRMKKITFEGIEKAQPAMGMLECLREADAIFICPSNPFVSIDPILTIAGVGEEIINRRVIAISPIIGDHTVKGPAAKMFREQGIKPSAIAVAEHYRKFLSGFVLDKTDQRMGSEIGQMGIAVYPTDILMRSEDDQRRLADDVLNFVASL